MFITEGFWLKVFIFILILVAVFLLLNMLVLRKMKNVTKAQNITINIMVAAGIIYLFYRIYKVIPEILNPSVFLTQQIFSSIVNVCVLALATTGIVLIFKTSTTTNFAQGMVATFGAFVAAKVIVYLTATFTEMNATLMVVLAMIGSALTAFILGILIDTLIIRKSKLPTAVGKQMITMGLVLIFSGLMPIIFGTLPLAVPKLSYAENIKIIIDDTTPLLQFLFNTEAAQLSITMHAMYSLIITVVLLVLLFSLLRFTKWGLGVRATASNELVANMMGVNTRVITAMSWAIAGLLGGTAAVILAPSTGTLQVSMMIPTQVNAFLAAILGSFSSFAGPLIATIITPVLTGLLVFVVPLWQNAVVYIIILVIVLVKPSGLFGKQIAKKV